jgi:hypothetical protein
MTMMTPVLPPCALPVAPVPPAPAGDAPEPIVNAWVDVAEQAPVPIEAIPKVPKMRARTLREAAMTQYRRETGAAASAKRGSARSHRASALRTYGRLPATWTRNVANHWPWLVSNL